MSKSIKNIWLISREYAGIAEAGGVKNVTCSLCEGLSCKGMNVTLLIPRYKCTDFSSVTDYRPNVIPPRRLSVADNDYIVSFDSAYTGRVHIIFVTHQIFSDKSAVYTYTAEDEEYNQNLQRGSGFHDALIMDTLFQKAVLEYGKMCGKLPEIIHCQDAATAFIPTMARHLPVWSETFKNVKFAVTIHNAGPGYHHEYYSVEQAAAYTGLSEDLLAQFTNGQGVEPFLAAAKDAALTTVSPWYADELLDSENEDTAGLSAAFFHRQSRITGITNGIDAQRYNPSDKHSSLLPFAFDPVSGDLRGKYANRDYFIKHYVSETADFENYSQFTRSGSIIDDGNDAVYFCYHGRIASQKGLDILADAAAKLLSLRTDVRFFLVGQGEAALETRLTELAFEHRGQCVYLRGYDRAVSRLSTAAADFIVLPSKFEPCGLEDFIAQLYGTIPVAHATGGLHKILDGKTGFLYDENTGEALYQKLNMLTDWVKASRNNVKEIVSTGAQYVYATYDWSMVIDTHYMPFYNSL